MIKINYTDNEIKITTENLSDLYSSYQLPLNVFFINHVTKKNIWSTQLNDYSWVSFPNSELVDTLVKDKSNKIVVNYNWDVLRDGSYHYKSFYLYCKNLSLYGRIPKGMAIGTHNGEFGEWVPLVLENKINSILIEASKNQFDELYENYISKNNATLLNCLVTPNGGEVEFFEGGRGYTNSVIENVIKSWEKEEIKSSIKKSISINELIKTYYPRGCDWLHLDVEGLDAKLIMSIEENLLPNFIIFEDFNLNSFEKTLTYDWLSSRNYMNVSIGGICTSIRK